MRILSGQHTYNTGGTRWHLDDTGHITEYITNKKLNRFQNHLFTQTRIYSKYTPTHESAARTATCFKKSGWPQTKNTFIYSTIVTQRNDSYTMSPEEELLNVKTSQNRALEPRNISTRRHEHTNSPSLHSSNELPGTTGSPLHQFSIMIDLRTRYSLNTYNRGVPQGTVLEPSTSQTMTKSSLGVTTYLTASIHFILVVTYL